MSINQRKGKTVEKEFKLIVSGFKPENATKLLTRGETSINPDFLGEMPLSEIEAILELSERRINERGKQ